MLHLVLAEASVDLARLVGEKEEQAARDARERNGLARAIEGVR
jgi:hypothetical protein